MDFLNSIQLWDHQKQAIKRVAERLQEGYGYFALFFEQGTGKTLTAICILRLIWRGWRTPRMTLILCPLIVVRQWREEIRKYAPSGFFDHVVVLEGTRKQRINQWKDARLKERAIYITNIDVLNTKFWDEYLSKTNWDIFVLDESQKVKTHNSKRAVKLRQVVDRIPYKFILSGTPILNSAMDIWGQYRVLSRNILPDSFYVFRKKYFEDKNVGMPKHAYFPNWQPKAHAYPELQDIIERHSMRVTKAEVLDLPPLVRQKVYVPLASEQKEAYQSMKRDFIAYLDDEACIAQIALTKLLRLLQICCGLFSVEGSEEIRRIETNKLKALKELLDDITPYHKVIVWANFIENYKDIAKFCGPVFSIIKGGQTSDERHKMIDSFQNTDECRVMIANQSAGGVGVNLTAASYMIYFSKNFSLNDDLQSEARAHRGGSEIHESITRIDIVTEDTVEEEVTEALYQKKKIADLLLDIKRKESGDTTWRQTEMYA